MGLFTRLSRPSVPKGTRIYAIGDIHGRYDLLSELIHAISDEQPTIKRARTSIILLGDLIDRGPQSRQVLELAYHGTMSRPSAIVLKGNHEDSLIASWHGDHEALAGWLDHGGVDTLVSFGADPATIDPSRPDDMVELVRTLVPGEIVDWLDSCPLYHEAGDYLFVHAGIRPGIPLARQDPGDLMWIRDEFLDFEGDNGKVVVHGHTVTPGVEFRWNRIGIDTGAYRTNKLSALCLSGTRRRIISTSGKTASDLTAAAF